MSDIRILDCTLRDGGYCNSWNFGEDNIEKIISGLGESKIDIIECGFLTDKVIYSSDITKFTNVHEVDRFILKKQASVIYVLLMNYGEYNIDTLPVCGGSAISGIRVAFHKKDMAEALECCRKIKNKGYKVFVQAMASLTYRDEEFIELIRNVNELMPYSFYIVDSFGGMKRKDLLRLYHLVENNLLDQIVIGFHSHNNMQLAYSNAQAFVDIRGSKDVIVDCSIYGMGRGAGNLNTELFVEYINEHYGFKYELKPLLMIIDEILNNFYKQKYWGFSLPNYLSAKYNSHPNYAGYWDEKKTLQIEDMDELFSVMKESKRVCFDKDYAEELYVKYMMRGPAHEENLEKLLNKINGKKVLVIAPGKSLLKEADMVADFAREEDVITISVNFQYDRCKIDYIFLSNLRRARELSLDNYSNCIVTSNVPVIDAFLQINYCEYINDIEYVRDNAGLMLINFLIKMGVKQIYVAGIDGYSYDVSQNYVDDKMSIYNSKHMCELVNSSIEKVLRRYSMRTTIEYITTPQYIKI